MASASNLQLDWRRRPEAVPAPDLPLAALPFPAVVLDSSGVIRLENSEWRQAHPETGPNDYCWKIHQSNPERCTALQAGIEGVLSGRSKRFIQDYEQDGRGHKVTISPHAGGALVLDQRLDSSAAQPVGADQAIRAEKMETAGRLLGGVAHDFANLITLIGGYSDILLNRVDARDPLRPELEEIRQAANRGARLTSQLLGFSRGQATDRKILDLNSIICETQRMLRPIIGEHVQLTTELHNGLDKVIADRGQMEQVIMNLILNARDAMPQGGSIRIETSNGEMGEDTARAHGMAPGRCIMLSITDSGHGIDANAMEHLFEPFFTTKEKGRGTGLGLNTVRKIIQESHGDIWVNSAPGEGTTFMICLPRAEQTADTGETSTAPLRPPVTGKETVLLVEDEEGVRRVLAYVLHKRGYRVIEASNGEEALQVYQERSQDIHLVVTDMVMPKMTGRELARQVHRIRPDTKVIFMSGYTDDVLARTGALGPGMSFLQKPLRPEVLAAKVREVLDSPRRPFNPW